MDPNAIVGLLVLECLQALVIELARLFAVLAGLAYLFIAGLQQVYLLKEPLQNRLRDPPYPRPTVQRQPDPRHLAFELLEDGLGRAYLRLMDALIAAQHTVHSGWLPIPVLHSHSIPRLLAATPSILRHDRFRPRFDLFRGFINSGFPHVLDRLVRISLDVTTMGPSLPSKIYRCCGHHL